MLHVAAVMVESVLGEAAGELLLAEMLLQRPLAPIDVTTAG